MKKLSQLLVIAGLISFIACGPSAKEKAEKAKQDSIRIADSIAKEMKAQDSIRLADSIAKVKQDSARIADSIANAKPAKPAKKAKK
jgi:hypothetical protein